MIVRNINEETWVFYKPIGILNETRECGTTNPTVGKSAGSYDTRPASSVAMVRALGCQVEPVRMNWPKETHRDCCYPRTGRMCRSRQESA